MNNKLKAFTLAEVLITLVIIGVIAAITVPSIHQNTKEKEFHSRFKKNVAVLENALKRAQADEGIYGDNTTLFTPTDAYATRSYDSALKFAKYVNAIEVCNGRDATCAQKYNYPIKHTSYKQELNMVSAGKALLIANDGTFWFIQQNEDCKWETQTCKKNEDGDCIQDEDGNDIMADVYNRTDCAELSFDVNGPKGPNKYGKDVFIIMVDQNKTRHLEWDQTGGKKTIHIMTGAV